MDGVLLYLFTTANPSGSRDFIITPALYHSLKWVTYCKIAPGPHGLAPDITGVKQKQKHRAY